MKHKVSELEGALLDWAVAKAEGCIERTPAGVTWSGAFSTDWSDGGPIIERERIFIGPGKRPKYPDWLAWIPDADGRVNVCPRGPTPLIAAMRAFVVSKLGEEVEL